MAVPRGNFIIQLLVEIDRSAEPERFDQKLRLERAAPRPEPAGKTQEVYLVEESSHGRDAVYPQREPQRLRSPDLQATLWRSLELELQALAAPPDRQGSGDAP